MHGRVVTCLVLSLVSGAYLTASSSLATISASTSCELPSQVIKCSYANQGIIWKFFKLGELFSQLVLPLANPMMVLLLAGSVLNLTIVQHTANDLQHEFVITLTQKVNLSGQHCRLSIYSASEAETRAFSKSISRLNQSTGGALAGLHDQLPWVGPHPGHPLLQLPQAHHLPARGVHQRTGGCLEQQS